MVRHTLDSNRCRHFQNLLHAMIFQASSKHAALRKRISGIFSPAKRFWRKTFPQDKINVA
ncbi:hypothetical protein SY94_3506 [Agrobacterium tumefaciens]|nr:hypothetical protein SY94_3506 [Agrobacterium tumefaciens]